VEGEKEEKAVVARKRGGKMKNRAVLCCRQQNHINFGSDVTQLRFAFGQTPSS
jgi:hypothetical protein